MSSSAAPMTPTTETTPESNSLSTSPPSSPPSDASKDEVENPDPQGGADSGVSQTMQDEEERIAEASRRAEAKRRKKLREEREKDLKGGDDAMEKKFKQLQVLLDKSNIYAKIMYDQMKAEQEKAAKIAAREQTQTQTQKVTDDAPAPRKSTRTAAASRPEPKRQASGAENKDEKTSSSKKLASRSKPKRQGSTMMDFFKKKDIEDKAGQTSVTEALAEAADDYQANPTTLGAQDLRSARQPDLVSGGNMRSYQLEGLEWLTSLYENGLNGILADEMGLGKTIQTISFLAFLRSKGVSGPFLVAAPLSTLSNWIDEFQRWTPDIPVLCYHGTPAERAELRRTQMAHPNSDEFPVICTSYEISMNDKKYLSKFGWKYIVIDEGHRLKNYNCKLIRDLKTYSSSNRLLITGTPLQNNLRELWSLLSFVMPDIFNEWETFESWFDFSALDEKEGNEQILVGEQRNNIVGSLHAILKPFLLRRVKADVESDLPRKREYILYAPLTNTQKELYDAIFHNQSRAYLENKAVERITGSGTNTPKSTRSASLKRKAGEGTETPNKSSKSSRASTPAQSAKRGKGKKRKDYREKSDREYFKDLEHYRTSEDDSDELDDEEQGEIERAKNLALARKEVSNKKLQNPVMQMRLACNSPHNFYYPWDPDSATPPDYSDLVTESGKMLLLDRLVPFLFSRGHKILIFSQFKTQLDLLEDWASSLHGWPTCRIDGSVAQADRQAQIRAFAADPTHKLFLLSTRAGGQGINLAAADTVILFDSDWNPQQDLQAQDRAHRIGQTKPVVVYRLTTRGTVEQKLLEKADGKRRLEKLVIRKGKFRSMLDERGGRRDRDRGRGRGRGADGEAKDDDNDEDADDDEDDDDLRSFLKRDDDDDNFKPTGASHGRELELLSQRDLEILTDRSDEAYDRAAKGLEAGPGFKAVGITTTTTATSNSSNKEQ
ncbi:MAG: hypothetical protein M1837_006880 [Sclerophora amabilis]|nr:MAG: hypothetical protein M1837_006880 [Sclerophora amabilis]